MSRGKVFPLVCDGPAIGQGPPTAASDTFSLLESKHLRLAAADNDENGVYNKSEGDGDGKRDEAGKGGLHDGSNIISKSEASNAAEDEPTKGSDEVKAMDSATTTTRLSATPSTNDCTEDTYATPSAAAAASLSPELFTARQCYTCKRHFTALHHFYHLLCPTCAAHNWSKRHQTADLSGKVMRDALRHKTHSTFLLRHFFN